MLCYDPTQKGVQHLYKLYRKRTKWKLSSLKGSWQEWKKKSRGVIKGRKASWDYMLWHCTIYIFYAGRQNHHKGYKARFKTNNITCLYASHSIHIHICMYNYRETEIQWEREKGRKSMEKKTKKKIQCKINFECMNTSTIKAAEHLNEFTHSLLIFI